METTSRLNLQELKYKVGSKCRGTLWSEQEVKKIEMQHKQRQEKNVLKGALLDLKHLSHNPEP